MQESGDGDKTGGRGTSASGHEIDRRIIAAASHFMTERMPPSQKRRRRVTNAKQRNPSKGERSDNGGQDEYADLVRAAAVGDAAALERLLMQAQTVAWRFSTSVCGHADDAEDAMQEALIKTYRYVGRIRDPRAFKPWLYRTVRNACLMGRRKRADEPTRLRSLDEVVGSPDRPMRIDAPDPGKNPEQLATNAALRRRLRNALRTLPAPYRAVVFLREMEGLSTREVARVMGMSEDNVKTRLHRARIQLQAALHGVER
jgi:RNA polymerase sigma-70 factor (ECF subfamily)